MSTKKRDSFLQEKKLAEQTKAVQEKSLANIPTEFNTVFQELGHGSASGRNGKKKKAGGVRVLLVQCPGSSSSLFLRMHVLRMFLFATGFNEQKVDSK